MSDAETGLVYVAQPVHPDALELLRSRGPVKVGFGDDATPFDAVRDQVAGILVRTAAVSAAMIDAAPKLRVIARHGVGTDAVDVAAATRNGIRVLITPEANAISVAEHTIGLLIAAARRFPEGQALVHAGAWHARDQLAGVELAGRTLGVLGLGRIGRRVARVAVALGMRVRAHDPFVTGGDVPDEVEWVATLAALLEGAHAFTPHVPLTPQTRGLVDGAALDLLAPGAVVVNAARGGIVDETALVEGLTSGRLSGAGIDVFSEEPPPADNPLRGADNAVLTPHLAAHTSESLRRMSVHAAEGIVTVLAGRVPDGAVQPVNPA